MVRVAHRPADEDARHSGRGRGDRGQDDDLARDVRSTRAREARRLGDADVRLPEPPGRRALDLGEILRLHRQEEPLALTDHAAVAGAQAGRDLGGAERLARAVHRGDTVWQLRHEEVLLIHAKEEVTLARVRRVLDPALGRGLADDALARRPPRPLGDADGERARRLVHEEDELLVRPVDAEDLDAVVLRARIDLEPLRGTAGRARDVHLDDVIDAIAARALWRERDVDEIQREAGRVELARKEA